MSMNIMKEEVNKVIEREYEKLSPDGKGETRVLIFECVVDGEGRLK